MRNCKADFEDTCKLMRKYMEQNRPQSFASVWGVFEKRCELNKISIDDVSDIYSYAKAEQIEKFGF